MNFLKHFLNMLLLIFPLWEGPIKIRCTYVIIAYILIALITEFCFIKMDNYTAEIIVNRIKVPGIVFFFLMNVVTLLFTAISGLALQTNLNDILKYNIAYFFYCIAVIPMEMSVIKLMAEQHEDIRKGVRGETIYEHRYILCTGIIIPFGFLYLGSEFPKYNVVTNAIRFSSGAPIFLLWLFGEVLDEIRRRRWKKKNQNK